MATRGTYQCKEDIGYEPKFILAYKKLHNEIGVSFLDLTTSKIYIGEFIEEDESWQNFRTLICQIRPVEIIQERDLAGSDIAKMLKNSPVLPSFTNLPPSKCYSFTPTCLKIEQLLGQKEKWPQVLQDLHNEDK